MLIWIIILRTFGWIVNHTLYIHGHWLDLATGFSLWDDRDVALWAQRAHSHIRGTISRCVINKRLDFIEGIAGHQHLNPSKPSIADWSWSLWYMNKEGLMPEKSKFSMNDVPFLLHGVESVSLSRLIGKAGWYSNWASSGSCICIGCWDIDMSTSSMVSNPFARPVYASSG